MPRSVSPARAAELIAAGAVLVDIRSLDEHARLRIPGAEPHPLATLSNATPIEATNVIFHCRSGMRTGANAQLLASCTTGSAYVLDGGIHAWARAGLPVRQDRSQPVDVFRQVQIIAGIIILAGLGLGLFVAPAFLVLPALIGVGSVFAGVTGRCALARVLMWVSPRRNASLNAQGPQS